MKPPRSEDGAKLEAVRNGCLADLWIQAFAEGFRGRPSGTRADEAPSPIPGSGLVMGIGNEMVYLYQDQWGRGDLKLLVYRLDPNGSTEFGDEVRRRLTAAGYLNLDPP